MSNSSKPPSSDIVKPPKGFGINGKGAKSQRKGKTKGQGKLRRSGQKGHQQHLRKPLALELVDEIVKLELTHCPDCGHKLDLEKSETKVTQQIELVEKPFFVTEYQQLMYWCKHCQCDHSVRLP